MPLARCRIDTSAASGGDLGADRAGRHAVQHAFLEPSAEIFRVAGGLEGAGQRFVDATDREIELGQPAAGLERILAGAQPHALGQRALVNLELVELLDSAHFDAAHLEPGIGGNGAKLAAGHRRNAGKACHHPCQHHRPAQDRGKEHALKLFLAER